MLLSYPTQTDMNDLQLGEWRRGSESNRRSRSCSPLHYHFATAPLFHFVHVQALTCKKPAILGNVGNKSTTYQLRHSIAARPVSDTVALTKASVAQPHK